MKTFVYNITDNDLKKEMQTKQYEEILNSKSILIQIFSGEDVCDITTKLINIKKMFAHAFIIGTSAQSAIINDTITDKSTVVSISIFESTILKSSFTDMEDSFQAGIYLAKELITSKTKLFISFINTPRMNAEKYTDGISSVSLDVIIAGGLSSSNTQESYIIHNDTIHKSGAVGIALDSDVLRVENICNFSFDKIGIKHIITKSVSNRVYTIDNIKAIDFYTKYLGSDITDDLLSTSIEFPLIKREHNMDIARAVIHKYEDGSLSFTGTLDEGCEVYLGIVDSTNILSNHINKLNNTSVESFFIYSCIARKKYIPNLVHNELTQFSDITTVSGFFTYGGFYTHNKHMFLNQALTATSLSELDINKKIPFKKRYENYALKKKPTHEERTYKAVRNFINQTVKEYNFINNRLEKRILLEKEYSDNIVNKYELLVSSMTEGILIFDNNNKVSDVNFATIKLLGYSQDEFSRMSLSDLAAKDSRETLFNLENGNNNATLEATLVKKDGSHIFTILNFTTIVSRDATIRMVIIVDMTELKEKDKQLILQSKQAQMGEMISMIAHQWRQPLHALSASAIQLNMKNELDILKKEDIKKATVFIEKMSQKMSQTINDFMNFTKTNNVIEMALLSELFKEIISIIQAQLTSLNIQIEIQNSEDIAILTLKQELSHILINLLANAKDALKESTKKDKKIILKVYKLEQDCYIEIQDNGTGIPKDIINRIFEPYFTTKEQGDGTGLGLYMTKKILNQVLNGNIEAKNTEQGTSFIIQLKDCL